MKELTGRQRECYEVIRSAIVEKGMPPTVREIGAAMGIASTNGVIQCLLVLEKKGVLTRNGATARGIRLVVKTHCPCCGQAIEKGGE